jgi:putative hydrolase of the HAD superfamily
MLAYSRGKPRGIKPYGLRLIKFRLFYRKGLVIIMKLRGSIKGIFFDAGWTLFYNKSRWLFPNEIIDPYLIDEISNDNRNNVIQKALKYLDDNHFIFTEEEEIEQFKVFYSMISSELPELAITKQKIDKLVHSQIYGTDFCFYDDTLSTLKILYDKYKLGIISDNWPSLRRTLKSGGVDNYFSTITISSYFGTFKSSPDTPMFDHALEQMKLPPEQTVFIDDGVENLDGAAKCGIQPVLITAKPNAESSDKYPSIKRLSELFKILP